MLSGPLNSTSTRFFHFLYLSASPISLVQSRTGPLSRVPYFPPWMRKDWRTGASLWEMSVLKNPNNNSCSHWKSLFLEQDEKTGRPPNPEWHREILVEDAGINSSGGGGLAAVSAINFTATPDSGGGGGSTAVTAKLGCSHCTSTSLQLLILGGGSTAVTADQLHCRPKFNPWFGEGMDALSNIPCIARVGH